MMVYLLYLRIGLVRCVLEYWIEWNAVSLRLLHYRESMFMHGIIFFPTRAAHASC